MKLNGRRRGRRAQEIRGRRRRLEGLLTVGCFPLAGESAAVAEETSGKLLVDGLREHDSFDIYQVAFPIFPQSWRIGPLRIRAE